MVSISASTFRVLAQNKDQISIVYDRGQKGRHFILEILWSKKDGRMSLFAFEVKGTERQGTRRATIRQRRIKFAMYLAYKAWRRRGEWRA